MFVTKIEELDKKRARIFLDMEFAFVLYKAELRKYQLKEGEEIGAEEYSRIVGEILPKRAKLRSMNLLKAKAYTERQLREKLQRGEYPEEIIEEAIAYVKSFGYIDDRQYAQDFIAYHMAERSGRRMEQELMAKGIRRDMKIWRKRGKHRMIYRWQKKFYRKKIMTRKLPQSRKNRSCQHSYTEKVFKWTQ